MNQFDTANSEICIQPINNQMISLSRLKAKNFLATTASKHYKVPEIEEPKPKRKHQNLAKIQFKFQIEEEDYSSVIREMMQLQKNRNPLMPLHLHFKPNPTIRGLSIGQIQNSQEFAQPITLDEYRNKLKTQKMSRNTNRDKTQDVLERLQEQLQPNHMSHLSSKTFTDRSKSSKLRLGTTFKPADPSQRMQEFEVGLDKFITTKKEFSLKQFNLYKNRNIATPNLSIKFKQRREIEQEQEKRILNERRREFDKDYFEKLP